MSTASGGVSPGVRGEAKRRSVVEAATRAFLSEGYGAASMDAIAAEAGASKRTVYNHFPSKRDLFRAVVARLYEGLNAPGRVPSDRAPAEALTAFAHGLLTHLRRPEVTGLLRLVAAEHRRFPELSQDLMREGKGPAVAPLEAYLAALDARGELRVPSPPAAASLFLGGIKEALFWPGLFGLPVPEDGPVVDNAVRAFLRGHRVGEPRGTVTRAPDTPS
ncbi:TetR/AcrR family transcriptional regulator [Azospirillum sp. TSO22-1]|uniref:TetR/AcrR family transcriptional regulator n=1 Tax=Azospirillum sp. TSO22-1 TaxID=716789 RepID=UPI000D612DC4|nr:TetR/AcrR family transcriptional regulator [Azospirillum sp. TSO22-1]PWC45797.1 transcriptional regulator [Azospirillum sp. TSO22-1]